MKKALFCSIVLLLSLTPHSARSAREVRGTSLFHSEKLGLTVVVGEVDLPAGGSWEIEPLPAGGALSQPGLFLKEKSVVTTGGRRFQEVERKKKVDMGRQKVSSLYGALNQFARDGDGYGPSSLSEIDEKRHSYVLKSIDESPWKHQRDRQGEEVEGPFVFFIPKVMILEPAAEGQRGPRRPERGEGVPIILELRPYVDDGKHWVAFTDGRTERVVIDRELVKKQGIEIRPVVSAEIVVSGPGEKVPYHLTALLTGKGSESTTLTVKESVSGERLEFTWKTAGAAQGDEALLALWARGRATAWAPYFSRSASVLRYWLARHGPLYGLENAGRIADVSMAGNGGRRGRRGRRGTTAFNILGGRAAVRETLQMQAIGGRGSVQENLRTVKLAEIEGVTVESHPFDEMLGGHEGGRLPLADHVPADRFFVYFTGPSALLAFLGDGADFVFHSGALFFQNSVEYRLKDRYFGRLGLSEEWVRKLLETGAVEEIALTTPDLFFIDGTDITVLAKTPALALLKPLLALVGVQEIGEEGITTRANAAGRPSYWAVRDDLLVISTSRSEAEKALALGKAGGEGSLGRSAEFRYMLTKLPLRKETRAYAYFSDSFIRRMVGPEVKIGQLRRMAARGEMEMITAGSLLALLDSGKKNADLSSLGELGYIPKGTAGRYSLADDLSARSETYGTVKDLKTLQEVPLEGATSTEVKAYDTYRENYTRFWRRFFDPIALRLDDAPDSSLAMTTFILPLLDATIYDGLREHLVTVEKKSPLNLPVLEPKPVMTLSLNMGESFWVKATGWWMKTLRRFAGFDTSIFDTFGPGIHLAVEDGDPIIVIGSGDMMGAFGGEMFSRGAQMMLPVVASILTRPCRLFIELQDEKQLLDTLHRNLSTTQREGFGGSQVSFHQVGSEDSWVYNFDLEGIVNFRLGLEVQGGYLIVSNLPWSEKIAVAKKEQASLNGARIALHPGSAVRQLPGLYYAAARRSQAAALQGASTLYPLLLTGSGSPGSAAEKNAALFGFTPTHPGPGEFTWEEGRIGSTLYGTAARWKHPPYEEGDRAFGLLQGVESLSVNMQLEDDGLRAVTRWKWIGARP